LSTIAETRLDADMGGDDTVLACGELERSPDARDVRMRRPRGWVPMSADGPAPGGLWNRGIHAAASIGPRLRALGFARRRKRLSERYLRGSGLEIGALHRPLPVAGGVSVTYVDRMDVAALRAHYPELGDLPLVDVGAIDNGETLHGQADASAEFVIANHFIEHSEDPIGTIASHLRVIRPGGILFLAVPDRRRTFDKDREQTPLEHLIRDHHEGPAWSRAMHQREWAELVEKTPAAEVDDRVRWLEENDYSIHFHVWERDRFREMLDFARDVEGLPFVIEKLVHNDHEFIAILRRT
jgi:SAM-dependent methyltransferase